MTRQTFADDDTGFAPPARSGPDGLRPGRARLTGAGRSHALRIELADDFRRRLLGLMFRRPPPGRPPAMLLTQCAAIHTAFMRFALDVVWLDRDGRVVGSRYGLKPWRLAWGPRGTVHTLELPAGLLWPLVPQIGDRLEHAHFMKEPQP